jgi:hypothetical protein
MLWKTLIGTALVVLPTGANLGALCVLEGDELAFVSHALTHTGIMLTVCPLRCALPFALSIVRFFLLVAIRLLTQTP